MTFEWIEQWNKPWIERGTLQQHILGVPFNEIDYINALVDFQATTTSTMLTQQTINKVIDAKDLQAVQSLYQEWVTNKLSDNRFIAFLIGQQYLPQPLNPLIKERVYSAFLTALQTAKQSGASALQRIFIDFCKYMKNYQRTWFTAETFVSTVPQLVWFGDMSVGQSHFLAFLLQLQFDVIILHPEKRNDLPHSPLTPIELPKSLPLPTYPTERREQIATVASQAEQQIQHVLNSDNSGLYKPWQFRHYTPKSATLKTTFDELLLIGRERAFLRPAFLVEQASVKIPSLFAKVSGVDSPAQRYNDFVLDFAELPNCHVVHAVPMCPEVKGNYTYHYQFIRPQKDIVPEKMLQANWWDFAALDRPLQLAIAEAMKRTIEDERILPIANETAEQRTLYIFAQLTEMPAFVGRLLETFDYAQHVPKVVFYLTEQSGTLTRSDAIRALFLHQMGCDVLFLTPTGRQDIEPFCTIDVHLLAERHFNYPWPTRSAKLSSWIKNIFK